MRGTFDFTPGDLLIERSRDGYYHLGDIDLRLRPGTSGEWKNYSTALARIETIGWEIGPGILRKTKSRFRQKSQHLVSEGLLKTQPF
ncbi:MAG TPA: DUF5695 domain-containing protein [Candidatus Bathyarchaeia archaeon]|nr:DUF5695 domain-containing protein [Candidatus Bathyarchaeia archaeon]